MSISILDRVWFDTRLAADYIAASETEIREALETGAMRGYQRVRRGKWRIHRDDLDSWARGEDVAA